MKWLFAFLITFAVPTASSSQTAGVEADHIYVFVTPGGLHEAAALRALGFQVDSTVTRHVGGGTASRSAKFENFYLELLWIDSTVSVSDASRDSFAEMQHSAAWRANGASPFGLGLRKVDGPDDYGVPAVFHTDNWMQEGTAITLLRQADEPSAFDVFVVPPYMSVPAWIDGARHQTLHSNGSLRVSAVEVRGPSSHHPRVLQALTVPNLRATKSSEPLLILEIDDRKAGQTHDLRPLLPLLIRR